VSYRPQTGGGGALTEVLAALTTLVAVAASSLVVLRTPRAKGPPDEREPDSKEARDEPA